LGDDLHSITYFTALANWRSPDAVQRHRALIEANEVNGINVVLGNFKRKQIHCSLCNGVLERHEEKATDVNIALYAYRLASKGLEQIILVTGDTDLIPAIKMIKEDFPTVRVGVIFPYDRMNKELKKVSCFHHKTRKSILYQFLLPDRISKSNNHVITCPANWR
jgi:uncharacterized LabA/DUF88 family protein